MLKTHIVLALGALITSGAAQAGVEGRYVESLRNHGYDCTRTPKGDGTFCVKGRTYVTIPNGLASHTHDVFYAHGLVGVCGNGASGENYLKNESPTLQRIGAIAIMPYRPGAADTSFPIGSYLSQVESDLGGEQVPLIMAGHSAAGTFLGAELAANPKVAARVDQALLIDAIYGADRSASLWIRALSHNPRMKVKLVSSTTAAASRAWMSLVKPKYPADVSLELKGERHCEMPKYFRELE